MMQEIELKSELLLTENSYIEFMKFIEKLKSKNKQFDMDQVVQIWVDPTMYQDYLMQVMHDRFAWKWKINSFYDDGSYIVERVKLSNLMKHIRPYVPTSL